MRPIPKMSIKEAQAIVARVEALRLRAMAGTGVTAFDLLAKEESIASGEALALFTDAQRTVEKK